MGERSLHNDNNLHEFKRMSAELADGRHAAVEIDEDGHLRIVAVWTPGQRTEEPSYPQKQIMEEATKPEPKLSDPPPQSKPKADPKQEQMIKEAEEQSKPKKAPEAPPETQAPQANPAQEEVFGIRIDPPPVTNDPNAMTVIDSSGSASAMLQQMLDQMPKSKSGQGIGGGDGKVVRKPWNDDSKKSFPRDSVFLARLESVMNDNQFDRRLRGRTRGKLDMTHLYKAQTGSTSVFTQKSLRRNKRYNIALLVDQSGSMRASHGPGSRAYMAAELAQFLAEHFNRLPGIELMITGFDSQTIPHKAFGQHVELDRIYSQIISSGGGGTHPNKALKISYEALKKQPDGQNLVIYMADGDSDDREETEKIIKSHKALATTIGVGIQCPPIAFVDHSLQIRDLPELKPQLIALLQKEIKRG